MTPLMSHQHTLSTEAGDVEAEAVVADGETIDDKVATKVATMAAAEVVAGDVADAEEDAVGVGDATT